MRHTRALDIVLARGESKNDKVPGDVDPVQLILCSYSYGIQTLVRSNDLTFVCVVLARGD